MLKTKSIIILDGPPASGKTKLAASFFVHFNTIILNYKALGPTNIIAQILMLLSSKNISLPSNHDPTRQDPLLFLNRTLSQRLSNVFFLLELFYKALQVTIILLCLFIYRIIIVDEFLALRFANYFNFYKVGGLKKRHVSILMQIDFSILKVLSRFGKCFYYYINRNLNTSKQFWKKRGHTIPYDTSFFILTNISWNTIKKFLKTRTKNVKILEYSL